MRNNYYVPTKKQKTSGAHAALYITLTYQWNGRKQVFYCLIKIKKKGTALFTLLHSHKCTHTILGRPHL